MRRLTIIPRRDGGSGRRSKSAGRAVKAPPRRRAARLWRRPGLRHGAAALVAALVVGSVTWLWFSGRVESGLASLRVAFVEATVTAGLTIGDVLVTGRRRTPRSLILKAIGVRRGEPLLTFDPEAARRRVEAIGWVGAATVERRFPDTIFVRLEEREPMALWQRNRKLTVVDRDGIVIVGAAAQDFAGLPLIVGSGAPENAPTLLTVMATEPVLHKQVEAAVWVGGRRWDLRLGNGIAVQLPEENLGLAWRRLADYDRRHRLLARDIAGVDLRLPDRLVVQPAKLSGAKGKHKKKGKST